MVVLDSETLKMIYWLIDGLRRILRCDRHGIATSEPFVLSARFRQLLKL